MIQLYAYLVASGVPPFVAVQRVVAWSETPKPDKKMPGVWALVAGGEPKALGERLLGDPGSKWLLRCLSPADRAKLGISD